MNNVNQEEKFIQMTTTPIPKLICSLSVPTIISMLMTSIYNMADTFFVGRISTQATAAVGVAFPIMALIQAIGFFFGQGSGNFMSRMLGKRDGEKAEQMAITGIVLAFICGVIVASVCIVFINPLAIFLGSTDTILPYAKSYLRIILIGMPFMMSTYVLNNQLRFQGRASVAMIGIISGGILNMILDPILIFVCDLGITGAALATILGQIVSFSILLYVDITRGSVKMSFRNIRINGYYLLEITRGGFPSLCRQGLGSIATICLNHSAGMYGDAAIAAMSVVGRIMFFANSALIGFGQGFQPVCGFNYGAKLYKRVREGFYFCVKYAFIFLLAVSAIGIVFAEQIVLFFRDDPDVARIGMTALRFQCITFPLSAYMNIANMMLQSIGRATKASLVAASRQGLFFIPLVIVLPMIFGLMGVQICQTVSDVFSMILTVPLTASVLKEFADSDR